LHRPHRCFSLFFPEKTAGHPANAAEFLGFWQLRWRNNSEKQRAITAKNTKKQRRRTANLDASIMLPRIVFIKISSARYLSAPSYHDIAAIFG
jgi:hypothetical protein